MMAVSDAGNQAGVDRVRTCGWERSPGLFTDLYQLTMANAYWRSGIHELEACFHISFRENPFGGGYAVACGLEHAIEYLNALRFTAEDLEFLAVQKGRDGEPLFGKDFLDWLGGFEFTCDVDAVEEGTIVFKREPVLRVTGPIVCGQLVETALLNIVNFQTLVATKAARVCEAARGDPVVEFGLRRAQGPDGGISASRAAYVGGCVGTSNTLAAASFGIPAVGTHAHSWVMAFNSEIEAFEAYAQAMPNNCTFLVDTYDTLEGVRHAVEVGRRLRERGHEMIGIRIDSGDLAWLSVKAREVLDAAGFPDAVIVASNELDEHLIESLKEQGAAIDVWGVGTKLATAWDQPALGGVYKLSAVRPSGSAEWVPRLKVSEQTSKVTMPGLLGVRRYRRDGRLLGDMIYDVEDPPVGRAVMVDPLDPTRSTSFAEDEPFDDLLVPVFRGGRQVYSVPALEDVRRRAVEGMAELDPRIKRLLNPHTYEVGIESGVYESRRRLIFEARQVPQEEDG